jgi:hypothetical protein
VRNFCRNLEQHVVLNLARLARLAIYIFARHCGWIGAGWGKILRSRQPVSVGNECDGAGRSSCWESQWSDRSRGRGDEGGKVGRQLIRELSLHGGTTALIKLEMPAEWPHRERDFRENSREEWTERAEIENWTEAGHWVFIKRPHAACNTSGGVTSDPGLVCRRDSAAAGSTAKHVGSRAKLQWGRR